MTAPQPFAPGEAPTATKFNKASIFHADTIDELRDVVTAGLSDYIWYRVGENNSFYNFNSGSVEADNGDSVIEADGTGRFIKAIFTPAWLAAATWITDFPSADDDKGSVLATDGAGAIEWLKLPGGPQVFTQSSHGFVAKDDIRHNGSSWVKAQGNSYASATGVWTVIESIDANTFRAAQIGIVEIPSHGFSAGQIQYLSATSAGSNTSTLPIGGTSNPLGFYLPVLKGLDSNYVNLLGVGCPQFNPILAQYKHLDSFNQASSITFSNLNVLAYGGLLEVDISMGTSTNGGSGYIYAQVNGNSGNNYGYHVTYENNTTAGRQRATFGSTNIGMLAYADSISGFDQQMTAWGVVKIPHLNASQNVIFNFDYTWNLLGNTEGRAWGPSSSNVTSLTIGGSNFSFRMSNVANHVNLYWKGPLS